MHIIAYHITDQLENVLLQTFIETFVECRIFSFNKYFNLLYLFFVP